MAIRKAASHEIKRALRDTKGAPKSSAHLKSRKGSAPSPSPAVQMAVVGVAGL